MEDLKTKENNIKKAKRKIMLISVVLTLIIVLATVIVIFSLNKSGNNSYTVPNSYKFSGNILSTASVSSEISLVIEEKDNLLYGITLKNNELVSQKVLSNNIDYSEITDFGVVLSEYNNDKNKDFTYIYDKSDNGYIYKFYSIDSTGNIADLEIENATVDSKMASLKFTKSGDKFEYVVPIFYYDGYKVSAEIGEHKLTEKANVSKKTISKTSKIAIEGKYNAIPRKYTVGNEISEYIQNVNTYLIDISKKQCIEVDLDGNNEKEYIISTINDKKTSVALFDSSANLVSNILEIIGEKEISNIIEIADIDNDGIMEIIAVKDSDTVEVHKYNNGFYY